METADWIMVGGIIAILGFLYRLQDRVGTLDQRMISPSASPESRAS